MTTSKGDGSHSEKGEKDLYKKTKGSKVQLYFKNLPIIEHGTYYDIFVNILQYTSICVPCTRNDDLVLKQ